jgi:hypothetical protein
MEISNEGKTFIRKDINITQNDTLNLKFKYNSYYDKSWRNTGFRITQDSVGNNIIYSNNIRLYVMKTDEPQPYLQVEKISLGRSMSEARKRAEYVDYNFEIEGNNIILDNYLTTKTENKYRNQKVELFLYLPEGFYFKPDGSVKHYDVTDNSFFDLWFDSENVYRMDKNNVECITCDDLEEMNYDNYEIGIGREAEEQEEIEIYRQMERIELLEKPEKPEKTEKPEKPEKPAKPLK